MFWLVRKRVKLQISSKNIFQVSTSTGQLFLAFQVKADVDSTSMEGLKNAKNAIKKATDELVRVAKDSLKQETVTMDIKPDIFKEVREYFSLYVLLLN